MPNIMDGASSWLTGKLKAKAGITIKYRRGAVEIEDLTATRSSWEFVKSDPSLGPTVRITTRDFLITAADLEAGGISLPPERGDEITETLANGDIYTHRLLPIEGEPFWRWFDSHRRMIRVHTKETGAA